MKTIKSLLLVTFPSVIVIFIILEIASRLFFPGNMAASSYYDNKDKMVKYNHDDGETGLWTKGNLSQLRANWRINNEGWNSPVDYFAEKKDGVTRIAIIGDSYIEAFQVDIDRSYPYVLSDLLGEKSEVYSFGISGAQLSQYLHIARYVEKKFSPDVYIFNIVHNDFDESINGTPNKRMFLTVKYESGSFTEIQPEQPERDYTKVPLSSLFKLSSFFRYLYHNLELNNMLSTRDVKEKEASVKEVEMNVFIDEILKNKNSVEKVTAYLLGKIKSELKEKEIIFIMDAPRWQIYEGNLEKAKSKELNIIANRLCDSLGLKFIDLTSYMLDDYNKNKQRFETDYDGHWSENGHKFVAEVLHEAFKKI
jgi:hypothetical protein